MRTLPYYIWLYNNTRCKNILPGMQNRTKGCKMHELKCPFCSLDIRTHRIFTDGCDNTHSPLWQEFIRIRKALDVTINELEKMTWGCNSSDAEHLLKEIKEITEQKNNQ